jgi:predicted enzyme related to lactoylglutathione lyase
MPEPTSVHGKICYIEMPATDVDASAEFYQTVFGWSIRADAAGTTAFDDTTGEVSGLWDTNRTAVDDPGMLISIMVKDAVTTAEAIVGAGGTMMTPVDPDQDEVIATFRDPAGNLLSIYENRDMA